MVSEWRVAVLVLLGCASLGIAVAGGQVELTSYVRSDMELISQESMVTWSPAWTGPIEGATILAWLNKHGYSQFVRDWNGDGVIDELDTIILADRFGSGAMQTTTPRGTTDARLVSALAHYVAELYPDEFELKIYDSSFPAEYAAEGLGTFGPDVIPGILLTLREEATPEAYKSELQAGETVIVGLETTAGANNRYFAGRSFVYKATSDGYVPIDVTWAEEDLWTSGHQGQVLQTLGKLTDRFYLQYQGVWTPVEFMLALSPIHKPGAGTAPTACPSYAIVQDVQVTTTVDGQVSIEECVTRQVVGDIAYDTYRYTVTNISLSLLGCGICYFYVPGAEEIVATTTSMTGPPLWMSQTAADGWRWLAPTASCGIQAGESAVFSFTVVGPTTDGQVTATISSCPGQGSPGGYVLTIGVDAATTGPTAVTLEPPPPGPTETRGACCVPGLLGSQCYEGETEEQCAQRSGTFYPGKTCSQIECSGFIIPEPLTGACCCRPGNEDCAQMTQTQCETQGGAFQGYGVSCSTVFCLCPRPDLRPTGISTRCYTGTFGNSYRLDGAVVNDGNATSPSFSVRLFANSGFMEDVVIGPLDPGESASYSFHDYASWDPCPAYNWEWQLFVDVLDDVTESNEANNNISGTLYCSECRN